MTQPDVIETRTRDITPNSHALLRYAAYLIREAVAVQEIESGRMDTFLRPEEKGRDFLLEMNAYAEKLLAQLEKQNAAIGE